MPHYRAPGSAYAMNEDEKQTIIIASENKGKVRELKALLEGMEVDLRSLSDYPDAPHVEENGRTFLENAFIKARTISDFTGMTVIADDSGLEVDALGGRPGIYSARYAGDTATDEENICKLLYEMGSVPEGKRGAAFRCVLVLYRTNGTSETFEGTLRGSITREPSGKEGFGYDPVFFVPEYMVTVAELDPAVKNRISHRGKAFAQLKDRLAKDQAVDKNSIGA